MAITYKIYPPIGVARLGRSNTAFYVGPERCHHLGVEIDLAGNETDVRGFKDAQFQHKRQAARFRIFEFEDGAQPGKPFEIPNGAQIEWSVELAKVKDAVTRPFLPPPQPTRPNRDPGRVERAVTPNLRTISGESASGIRLDTGTYLGTPVDLGEIRTDADQNLLMLGAGGFSQSPLVPPAPITSFYNNP